MTALAALSLALVLPPPALPIRPRCVAMMAEDTMNGKMAAGALASSALLAEGIQYAGTAVALAFALKTRWPQ